MTVIDMKTRDYLDEPTPEDLEDIERDYGDLLGDYDEEDYDYPDPYNRRYDDDTFFGFDDYDDYRNYEDE